MLEGNRIPTFKEVNDRMNQDLDKFRDKVIGRAILIATASSTKEVTGDIVLVEVQNIIDKINDDIVGGRLHERR